MEAVPAAAMATLTKEAEGGKITEVERLTTNGKTLFEVEVRVGEKEFELVIGLDGKLISREAEDEDDDEEEGVEGVKLGELPAAVRATIEKEAKGGKVTEVELNTVNGKTIYEAELKVEVEVTVDADGRVLSREVGDDDDDDE